MWESFYELILPATCICLYSPGVIPVFFENSLKVGFDELGVKKIPKVKDLNEEYARLLSGKKTAYAECRKLRDEAQELVIAEANIRSLYDAERKEVQEQQKEENRL